MKRFFGIEGERSAWGMAALVAACCAAMAIWFGALNQDEGWYLYAAQMVKAGKLPYHDYFFTQGPTMPFVYSALSPLWGAGSPLHGLLGGRVVTCLLGLFSTLCAVALVRRLVSPERRFLAGLVAFAMLSCNLYHVYFTTIPKTYALGGLFLLAGLLMIERGLRLAGAWHVTLLAAGGMALAFATGTRISLLLVLPAVGFSLLAGFRELRWSFLWFGLGGMLGLFLTYGLFALDPQSLRTLLAAQSYHAARGGFDPFFAVGSVSRLARGYAALGVALFAALLLSRRGGGAAADAVVKALRRGMGFGFAAVFLLQLSAPFPYDDYQVPLMGMLTVMVAAAFANGVEGERERVRAAWFAVLAAGMVSFVSPLMQEWMSFPPDRFWSRRKEMSELARLREMARKVEAADPGGKTLLTQDLYLAVECGRSVPEGLEMGPFSFFPELSTEEAKATHVLNRELMERLLRESTVSMAACSGYAFAIAAPRCSEVPQQERERLEGLLRQRYEQVHSQDDFGQNATTLRLFRLRSNQEGAR